MTSFASAFGAVASSMVAAMVAPIGPVAPNKDLNPSLAASSINILACHFTGKL